MDLEHLETKLDDEFPESVEDSYDPVDDDNDRLSRPESAASTNKRSAVSTPALFEDETLPVVAIVPRLDDLAIKALAENYHIYPALDRIPPEYVDNVVALLDPSTIDFTSAVKFITTDKFWKRFCHERWAVCDLSKHRMSYKTLYIERHLQELLEHYHPSKSQITFEKLKSQLSVASSFVSTLDIQEFLSHGDICDLFGDFENLTTLRLKYGAPKLGMDYDKALFGMQLRDAASLARLLQRTTTLSELTLSENLLLDEMLRVLCSGLAANSTIAKLDLSHNKLGDTGAQCLADVLSSPSTCITSLDLSDNVIGPEGGQALAIALTRNTSLQSLRLRLNPLGDTAGAAILRALARHPAISQLDVAATELGPESGAALIELLRANSSLAKLDLCSNNMFTDEGNSLLSTLQHQDSSTLSELDARHTPISSEVQKGLRALMAHRLMKQKRLRRIMLQAAGWDEELC